MLAEKVVIVQEGIYLGLTLSDSLLALWRALLRGRVAGIRVLDLDGGGAGGGGGGSVGGVGGVDGGDVGPLARLAILRAAHAWLGEVGVLDGGALDFALAADGAGQTGALLGGVGGLEGLCTGSDGEGLEVWRRQRGGVHSGR